jgi:hypothetical protein
MSHVRAPQFVLGGEARDGWTRAADPPALDDRNPLAGSAEMPGEELSALTAAENHDVEMFRTSHATSSR